MPRATAIVFRGFERFLQNHDPRDAALMTMRDMWRLSCMPQYSCFQCLDELFGVADQVPKDALVMRNIHQGMNFIASHAAHVYVLFGPDLANPAYHDILTQYGDTGNAVWDELSGVLCL